MTASKFKNKEHIREKLGALDQLLQPDWLHLGGKKL